MEHQAEPSKSGIISLIVMILLIILVVALSGPIYRALSGGGGKTTAYTSVQQGYGGEVKVTLSVKDGTVNSLTAEGNSETPGIGQKAIAQYNETVFSGLSGTSVMQADTKLDAISGATYTSQAVAAGYAEVLEQAKAAVQNAE